MTAEHSGTEQQLMSELELRQLQWRSRRGLLENDLLIEKFFNDHGPSLSIAQGKAMTTLMNLADNDLLDLLLRRTEPQGDIDTPEIHGVLELIRPAPYN